LTARVPAWTEKTIFTKSSGKIAEFLFKRIEREKKYQTVNFSKNWPVVLIVNLK
jgi:nuclear transport factor 2 (NTF2) superfamily protein